MYNITNYVWDYGKETFAERGFTKEDALVLSEFCYLKYDGLVPGMNEKPILLSELDSDPDRENLFWDKRYEKDNRALYNAIVSSRRFKNLRLGFYNNIIDLERGTQFSAITYFLDSGITVVTFRGTDETMVGWQEDFAMMLKKPIVGQTLSVEYLTRMSEILPGDFYVTGHSKGGNLAMYSVMESPKEIQDRVTWVYSFDGPGFRPELIAEHLTDELRAKSHTYIPRSSPIGLMLSTPGDMTVIEASSIGAMQHNPYNWHIKNGELVETELSEQHKLMMKSTNEWIFRLNDEEIQEFVTLMCWMLDATKAETTIELQDNFGDHFKALYKANKENPQETKELAYSFMQSYLSLAGENIKAEVKEKYENFLDNMRRATTEAKNGFIEKKEEMIKSVIEFKDDVVKNANEVKVNMTKSGKEKRSKK